SPVSQVGPAPVSEGTGHEKVRASETHEVATFFLTHERQPRPGAGVPATEKKLLLRWRCPMFAFTLETLVLRGVVRTGELAVLRLFGVEATGGLPGSNVHPFLPPARTGPDATTDDPPANPMVAGYATKGVSPGAGRSCRQIESSRRHG